MRSKKIDKYIYLSHILKNKNPSYGKVSFLDIRKIKSIGQGSSANVYEFYLQSHYGTHVDLPNHFFSDGNRIDAYPPGFWHFASPQLVDVRLAASGILRLGKWSGSVKKDTDILLLRSSWSRFRNRKKYCLYNPGIHPEVGLYLRKKYPGLKAIGIDWISISPYQNRYLGRQSHKAFLDPRGKGSPIVVIEDMILPGRLRRLKEVYIAPLRVDGIDSAPCTITGIYHD